MTLTYKRIVQGKKEVNFSKFVVIATPIDVNLRILVN